MKRRMYNESVIKITTSRATYLVVYKRLNNGVNGNPRYEFRIINVSDDTIDKYGQGMSAVYRADGHYTGDLSEVSWIVEQYEEELRKES